MRRRLLQRLEQGVLGALGEHVDLVQEVDLVAPRHRVEDDVLTQLADVVDTVVAGGVLLDEVHGPAFEEGAAGVAFVAGLAFHGRGAVGGLSDKPPEAGLAGASRSGQEVGVSDASGGHGVAQSAGDKLLADDLSEGLGAPLTVQDLS